MSTTAHTDQSAKDEAASASWTCERQDEDNGDIYWAIHDALTYEFIANVYSNEKHARAVASAVDAQAALRELHAFVGVMFGFGPDAVIPETVRAPLGVDVKVGAIMRHATAVLTRATKD